MFSIVNGVVLTPLPFERAERLLHVEETRLAEGRHSAEVPIHDFRDWREQQTSFESLAAWYQGTVDIRGEEAVPVRLDGAFVTPELFPRLLRLVLRQGLSQLGLGLGAGLLLAAALSRALEAVLFRVDPWDPRIFAGIAAALALVGLGACLVPARRASRVDPLCALRYD